MKAANLQPHFTKSRGAALITVLIIVFIVMAIITNITVRNYRVIRRLTNQKVMEQCYGILFVAVDFGRAALATSGTTSKTDALTDIWAQPIPKTKLMDDILLSGYVIDEQSKFNINDLVGYGQVNQTVLAQFTKLVQSLNIPEAIATSIAYYMASPRYQGSITDQYINGNPAYRPSGKPMIDLSELILIKGMQSQWVYKLNQYVTAIPQSINYLVLNESATESQQLQQKAPTGNGSVLVNVNTASAEVIAAKSGIPLTVAQRMTTVRENAPFKSQQDITNFLTSNGIILSQNSSAGSTKINPSTLGTNSTYFTIHAVVDKGDYEFKWVALVFRANRSGQWPRILWQHPE